MPSAAGVAYRTADAAATPVSSAAVELVVTDDDTALALGSGDVPVLATPRVVALAEEATVHAVDGDARARAPRASATGCSSTTSRPPRSVGTVRAEATLEAIEGRRLTFRVSVSDGHGLVAAGRITRVVVERARFLEKAAGD